MDTVLSQEVLKMRSIPWQTPHTYDKDGKLVLTESGQEWLDKAVKKREKLAEEIRAEAGESSFRVEDSIRKMWVKDQLVDEGVKEYFHKADNASDMSYRRHPEDVVWKSLFQ